MTKYKAYFQKMLDENQDLFSRFQALYDKYQENEEVWQREFNQQGKEILKTIHEYENKLCHHSEGGQYAKFAGNLAEKFQALVRQKFPLIDHVGIVSQKPGFSLKKINL